MPDRIPALDRLASEAKDTTMLPAAEIRRRGTRRRITRQVGLTAGALAIAATAGVGVWQSPLLDQGSSPQWAGTALPQTPTGSPATTQPAPTPTPTPTPEATPPTWANVPTADMLFPDYSPGEVKDEYASIGQAAHGLCDPGQYGEPVTVLTREFGTAGDFPSYIDAIVFGYESAEAATAGFDLLKDAAVNCAQSMQDTAGLTEPRIQDASAEVPFDPDLVDADPARLAYVTQVGLIPESEFDSGMFGDTLLLQAGARVLWVTSAFEGMDNNCVPAADNPDMEQCQLPAAVAEALETLNSNA